MTLWTPERLGRGHTVHAVDLKLHLGHTAEAPTCARSRNAELVGSRRSPFPAAPSTRGHFAVAHEPTSPLLERPPASKPHKTHHRLRE